MHTEPQAPFQAHDNSEPFVGFEPLEGNFVFSPNQFTDLVVANHCRPVVRLVGYILYETLRWLDENGKPVQKDISISFNDLVFKAGISRGSIRKAIALATEAKLIRCVNPGRSKQPGYPGRVGEYAIQWDETGAYAKSVSAFRGFYVGQGNRSPIPHSFFTHVIPSEPLAVIKVVATILRYTVGYQNQYGGGRKQEAQLSYRSIQRFARIASPTALSAAIQHSVASNYVRRVRAGNFEKGSPASSASVYAVNWLAKGTYHDLSSKSVAGDRFKNDSRPSVQKMESEAFKTDSDIGAKRVAEDRFKKCSHINNFEKQELKEQQTTAAAESIQLLMDAGFDRNAAEDIARKSSSVQIQNQLNWEQYRNTSKNRLGLIRTAIMEDWSEPTGAREKQRHEELRRQLREQEEREQATQEQESQNRVFWIEAWLAAPVQVRQKCKAAALAIESNPTVRRHLQKKSISDNPPANFLIEFKRLHEPDTVAKNDR